MWKIFLLLFLLVNSKLYAQRPHAQISGPKPANWDRVRKETTHIGVVDNNMIFAPNLLERNALDKVKINDYLIGSGWTVKIVGEKKSKSAPKGSILSQDPVEFTEVKKNGEIKVIVSSGM
ncbi:MAG: PASTA domain-containing protein [Proteobacteria bacterium]|nr:MAG: PASTA domain-containing protein [Pseudomonadota bacterium]